MARRRRRVRSRPRPARRPRAVAAPTVEGRILALAREVAVVAATAEPPRVRRDLALAKIAAAFGEDGEITALLPAARDRARSDEALGLALAWIREQLRTSLEEILEAGVRTGAIRTDPPPAVLAWVLLAGCEALLHEAPGGGAVPTDEVLRALARLTEV
jgi:hypothetical protein